jgi:hypothetical protein
MNDNQQREHLRFVELVRLRDGHRCRLCGRKDWCRQGLSVHRIFPHERLQEGRYFTDNGVSLCTDFCLTHVQVNKKVFTTTFLCELIGVPVSVVGERVSGG